MAKLNRGTFVIQLRRGVSANLYKTTTTNTLHQAELLFATDTNKLYVSDGTKLYKITDNLYPDVVVNNGEVQAHNDDIMFL